MFDEFLTIGELEANTARLADDPRVAITALGKSGRGRSIDMISIGDGPRDALIVGVPHPNEAASAVTVERMIALLLDNEVERRGYRWHFIKAIDPDGLALNEGWIKRPLSLNSYLEHFFRPALDRQPETTFPLDAPGFHFDQSTPENAAWQKAFALTRPALHASLHHCDYGGVFYSLSRALPGALDGLEQNAADAGLLINQFVDDDVMSGETWRPGISHYPAVPELVAKAQAMGATWAYPWTVGEMSPGFGEAHYGSFTLVAEVPMWDSVALHDHGPSRFSRAEQKGMIDAVAAKVRDFAFRHAESFAKCPLNPDAKDYLAAIQGSLAMMPSSKNGKQGADLEGQVSAGDAVMLSHREFEIFHTEHVLFALRTYGYFLGLARAVLDEDPDNATALLAQAEGQALLSAEIASIEEHSTLNPLPMDVITGFQMQAIFVCAEALNAESS